MKAALQTASESTSGRASLVNPTRRAVTTTATTLPAPKAALR